MQEVCQKNLLTMNGGKLNSGRYLDPQNTIGFDNIKPEFQQSIEKSFPSHVGKLGTDYPSMNKFSSKSSSDDSSSNTSQNEAELKHAESFVQSDQEGNGNNGELLSILFHN